MHGKRGSLDETGNYSQRRKSTERARKITTKRGTEGAIPLGGFFSDAAVLEVVVGGAEKYYKVSASENTVARDKKGREK